MPNLRLTLDGNVYETDAESLMRVTIREAKTIKANTVTPYRPMGMSITDWSGTINDLGDPDILAIIVFLLRSRSGETVKWAELDDLSIEAVIRGFEMIPDPESGEEAPSGEPDGEGSAVADKPSPPVDPGVPSTEPVPAPA